ncbi:uncharacterized protein BDFB_004473, partial [Asbolus verrucosus]
WPSWCFLLVLTLKVTKGDDDDYNILRRDGSFQFGYKTPDSYHNAVANRNNVVKGEFGGRNPETRRIDSTFYTAGRRGYRPRGVNVHRKYDLNQSGRRPVGSRDNPYYDPYEDPSYSFRFRTRTYSRQEDANRFGDVVGKYNYVDDVGDTHKVEFVAGKNTGFHVKTPFPDSNPERFEGRLFYVDRRKPYLRGRTAIQRGRDGSYRFLAVGPDQRRTEVSDSTGHVRGSYTYIDDKGVQHSVHYIAGPEIGYRVLKNVKGPHHPILYPFTRPDRIPPEAYDHIKDSTDLFDTAASGLVKPINNVGGTSKPDRGEGPSFGGGIDVEKEDIDKLDNDLGKPGGSFGGGANKPPSGGGGGGSLNRPSEGGFDRPEGGFDRPEGGFNRPEGGFNRPPLGGGLGGGSGGGSGGGLGGGSEGGFNRPSEGSYEEGGGGDDDSFGDDLFGPAGTPSKPPKPPRPSRPSRPGSSSGSGGGPSAGGGGGFEPSPGGSGDDGSYRPDTTGAGDDGSYIPPGDVNQDDGSYKPGLDESGLGGGESFRPGLFLYHELLNNDSPILGAAGGGEFPRPGIGGAGGGGIKPTRPSGPRPEKPSFTDDYDTEDSSGLFGSESSNSRPPLSGGGRPTVIQVQGGGGGAGCERCRGTIVTNVGDKLFSVPPGVSVRAHVQSIDLLPLALKVPSPSEQYMEEMSIKTEQLNSAASDLVSNGTVTESNEVLSTVTTTAVPTTTIVATTEATATTNA